MKFWHKKPRRLTLRGWAAMDDLYRQIKSRAEDGEWFLVPELVFKILELNSKKVDRDLFWADVVQNFNDFLELNSPRKEFPILTSREKSKTMPWEYPGRSWYFWLNLFAKTYGWSEEKIASLDIDDAIGLYQEAIIEEQLEREWQWGLSEIAYEYNKSTKKSHLKALPRPDWMKAVVGKPKPVKTRLIHKDAMPIGMVVNLDEEK